MASNLQCVGLELPQQSDLVQLIGRAVDDAEEFGRTRAGIRLLRWYDPSGAGLVLALRGNSVADLTPTYRGVPGARFGPVGALGEQLVVAPVLDDEGEQVTAMAVLLEEHLLLPDATGPVEGQAAVIGLGVEMALFADEDTFRDSDASALGGVRDPGSETEPVRVGAESFISYGLFGDAAEAEPYALLNGVVLAAQRRTVEATGQEFVTARVRSAGFEADLCLPAAELTTVPEPGNVLAGTAYLVASLPFATGERKPSRRWWSRG